MGLGMHCVVRVDVDASYVNRRCRRNESEARVGVEEFGPEFVCEMDREGSCVAADDECGDHVTHLLEGGGDTE